MEVISEEAFSREGCSCLARWSATCETSSQNLICRNVCDLLVGGGIRLDLDVAWIFLTYRFGELLICQTSSDSIINLKPRISTCQVIEFALK